jgi:two-component system, LytTR family, sensor kinase
MSFLRRAGSWMIHYKLYHLPFWLLYHYLWWSITIGNPLAAAQSLLSSPYAVKNLFYVIVQAAGVYFNLYFLLPRLLEKGKYYAYLSSLLMTMILVAAIIAGGYYVSSWASGRSMMELYQVGPGSYWHFFQVNTFPSTVASSTLAMCVKLTKNWLQGKQREKLLEQEKLQTELKFLRSQLNPHFLFNTINSIFVLIHRNPDKASTSLAKFSELLRYQLYECNEHQIPLVQEIDYLSNFIELEKLRQEKGMQISVDIATSPDSTLVIAPFMLMPFVENAFKHVFVNSKGERFIIIKIYLEENEVVICVRNSISKSDLFRKGMPGAGGLGLVNIRRRLMLLYAGKHQLDIVSGQDEYSVVLRVCLESEPQVILKAIPV